MALKKKDLNLGDRVCSISRGSGYVISAQSSDASNRYPFMSPNERQNYVWVKFDNGDVDGWHVQLPDGFPREINLEDKVRQAEEALAAAKAELAESRTPKVGEKWVSGDFTATVKLVEDGFVFYTYVGKRLPQLKGTVRSIANFVDNHTKLPDL